MNDVLDDRLGWRLLNEWQQDFPLCPAPFAELAGKLGVAENVVLRMLEKLRRDIDEVSASPGLYSPPRV